MKKKKKDEIESSKEESISLEIHTKAPSSIVVIFPHPLNFSLISLEIEINHIAIISVACYPKAESLSCTNDYILKVSSLQFIIILYSISIKNDSRIKFIKTLKTCLSIPLTIRSILKFANDKNQKVIDLLPSSTKRKRDE